MSTTKGKRILSLDGGGIRGVSQLVILQAIMTKIDIALYGDANRPRSQPCDFFDLICGTSTGGLNALMLGRLKLANATYTKGSRFS